MKYYKRNTACFFAYLRAQVTLGSHEEPGEDEPKGVEERESVAEASVVVHGSALVRRYPGDEEQDQTGQEEGDEDAHPHLHAERHQERQDGEIVGGVQIRGREVVSLEE